MSIAVAVTARVVKTYELFVSAAVGLEPAALALARGSDQKDQNGSEKSDSPCQDRGNTFQACMISTCRTVEAGFGGPGPPSSTPWALVKRSSFSSSLAGPLTGVKIGQAAHGARHNEAVGRKSVEYFAIAPGATAGDLRREAPAGLGRQYAEHEVHCGAGGSGMRRIA